MDGRIINDISLCSISVTKILAEFPKPCRPYKHNQKSACAKRKSTMRGQHSGRHNVIAQNFTKIRHE